MARRRPASPTGPPGKHLGRRLLLGLLVVLLLGVVFRRPLLVGAGHWLVAQDPPEKCDAAVVLSGEDEDGTRTRTAVVLYKDGWVRKIVLSGARGAFGHFESDFSLPLALSLGVPRSDVLVVTHTARSTLAEAETMIPIMEKAGIRSIVVVTSGFHTARARKLFLRACRGRMRVLARPVENSWFQADSWWQSREGLKIFFYEMVKRVDSSLE